ncbi:MAG: hypothetical protein OEY38_13735 [Gammaproteobacteria bacterium]|nr:hypothetical protein [Gammaproteobacteria bacterium]
MDIEKYAGSLFSRVNDAKILVRETINIGGLVAAPNMCHHNVSELHLQDNDYIPVRGWLYFDLPGLDFVKFVAHSAIRKPNGKIVDITPSNASKDYPFLDGNLSEEEYANIVEGMGCGEIVYSTKGT